MKTKWVIWLCLDGSEKWSGLCLNWHDWVGSCASAVMRHRDGIRLRTANSVVAVFVLNNVVKRETNPGLCLRRKRSLPKAHIELINLSDQY
jgi:hypothetical protein